MAAWTRQGVRLDIELAVALEVSNLHLKRAETEGGIDGAVDFNRRLWGVVARLVTTHAEVDLREMLLLSARRVERTAPPIPELIDQNVEFARVLAGRKATEGSLKRMMEDWHAYKRVNTRETFSNWLLDRLDGHGAPASMAA